MLWKTLFVVAAFALPAALAYEPNEFTSRSQVIRGSVVGKKAERARLRAQIEAHAEQMSEQVMVDGGVQHVDFESFPALRENSVSQHGDGPGEEGGSGLQVYPDLSGGVEVARHYAKEIESYFTCCKAKGEVYIDKGNKVFEVDLEPETNPLLIEFELRVNAIVAGKWASVLLVGHSDKKRQPFIALRPDSSELYIAFNAYEADYSKQKSYTLDAFELEKWYKVQILRNSDNAEIYLNGQRIVVMDLPSDALEDANSVPVYVGNPWSERPKADMRNLLVCDNFDPALLPPPMKTRVCKRYENAGKEPLKRGNLVFEADVTDKFEVTFTINIEKRAGGWYNILHIGETNLYRAPKIWQYAGQDKLRFQVNGHETAWNGLSGDLVVENGKDYKVRVLLDDIKMYVWMWRASGSEPSSPSIEWSLYAEQRFILKDQPVYIADPWHTQAYATVWDAEVCSYY